MVTCLKKINLTFLFVILVLFMTTTINTMREMPDSFIYWSAQEYIGNLAVNLLLVFILLGLAIIAVKKRLYEYKLAWLLPGILLVVMQIAFFLILKPLALWDTVDVVNEAMRMVTERDPQIGCGGGYFERYGNIYPSVLLMYWYYSLLGLFSIDSVWGWTVLLCILYIDGAIVMTCRFVYLLRGKRSAYLCYILWLIHPYPYILGSFAYCNIFSIFFVSLELALLLQLYRAVRERKQGKMIINAVLLGFFGGFGFVLRVTNLIVLIAAVVLLPSALLCYGKWTGQEKKALGKATGLALLCFLLTIGTYYSAENRLVSAELREKNFPIIHWVAMGLNTETDGRFLYADEQETYALPDKGQKQELALKKIRDRLAAMDSVELCLHMNRKMTVLWSNSYEYYYSFLNSNTSYGTLYSWVSGEKSGIVVAYNQVMLLVLYLILLCGAVRRCRSGHAELSYLLLAMVFFGVCLFYVLWEVSCRYAMCFMPVVFILAAGELDTFSARELRLKSTLMILPVTLLLLIIIGSYSIPMEPNEIKTNECYSVFSTYRRTHLEIPAEGEKLEQSFVVLPGKRFNHLSIFMDKATASERTTRYGTYRLSLYAEGEKKPLEQMTFCRAIEEEYYHPFNFAHSYEAGTYYFVIESQKERQDGESPFRKMHNLVSDYNPGGRLCSDGEENDGKWDLIFDVLEVS